MTYSAMYGGRSGRAKGKAPKSKKLKCILCQAKGHDATTCPQLTDDQKKEQVLKATLMQPTLGFGKTHKTSRKAGTILNTAIGNNTTGTGDDYGNENNINCDNIFDLFRVQDDNNINDNHNDDYEPLIFIDGGCDIGATIDHIATTITNSNQKKAKITYQNAITIDDLAVANNQESNNEQYNNVLYGASICRFLIKPDHNKKTLMDNPRITTILETNPHTFFVIGLGPGFFLNGFDNDDNNNERNDSHHGESEDYKDAVNVLIEAIKQPPHDNDLNDNKDEANGNRIVGLYGKLDYSLEMVDMIGYDTTTQLNKLRATCQVAIQCQLPIQIKIYPSAVSPNYHHHDDGAKLHEELDETILQQVDAYKQVVKDLAKVLLEMTPTTDDSNDATDQSQLRIHLSSWSGTELHMNHLLQAFPNNLYIGLNATIGYTKHKHLHECTFAIPIHRCILESDAPNAIPSQLHNKKKIFCHSGCVLYTAVSIAEHKRHAQLSSVDVLRTTTQNTLQLYGCGGGFNNAITGSNNELALRIDEVKRHALEQRKAQLDQRQLQHDVEEGGDNRRGNGATSDVVSAAADEIVSLKQLSKKKNKKKNCVTSSAEQNVISKNENNNNDMLHDEEAVLAQLAAEMMILENDF